MMSYHNNISESDFLDNILHCCFELGQVDPEDINRFCNSPLWRDQYIPTACVALDESQFVIPGGLQAGVSSAEGRRNYTDLQETAMWNGGLDFPKLILSALTQSLLLCDSMLCFCLWWGNLGV